MENIHIRPLIAADLPLLQVLSRQTFEETFAADNSAENMQQYLEQGFSMEKLQAEWQDSHTAFYFAEHGSVPVGYLKLNFGAAQTELKDAAALEIERIYVLKAWHGQKVGQLLFEKALDVAHQAQVAYVWLGVWEKNQRAIRFYEKNGFEAFDTHIFILGDDKQTDIMMRRFL